jgi:hypothetical protein
MACDLEETAFARVGSVVRRALPACSAAITCDNLGDPMPFRVTWVWLTLTPETQHDFEKNETRNHGS